jgi:transcription elongation factor GreA
MSAIANIDRGIDQPKPADRTLLTKAGAEALAQELARLRHQLDVEFATRLSETRAFGELGNNDDYLQIKEEEAVVAARARRLETVLASAQIVDRSDQAEDTVGIGSLVEIEDLRAGTVRELTLTGGFEAGVGTISANSPVGHALLGKRPGDELAVKLPGGRSVRLRVIATHLKPALAA